ncbi:MAG: PEGA domain-containing protein [Kofleriaceae bacterium]
MRRAAALGLAVVAALAGAAGAQPSAEFRKEFEAGTDAYRLGDYVEARAHLERAAALAPTLPGPLRFLAAVDAAEQQWRACVEHARAAIVANPASTEIAATRKLHDDCRGALGWPMFTGDYGDGGALAVTANVAGAALTVGGLRAGAAPLPPRPTPLGPIEVVATRAGWKPARVTVTVIPGVVTDAVLTLEEEPAGLDVVDAGPAIPAEGWLRLHAPPGAVVTVDGQAVTVDERGRYPLAPGSHQVEVTAPGARPVRRTVRIDRGQERQVTVALEAEGAFARRRRLAHVALGAAAGLGAAGVATGWLALRAADQARGWAAVERARPTTVPLADSAAIAPLHTRADIDAAGHRARTLGLVSGVAYLTAGAALATGVYLLVRNPDHPGRATVVPVMGDGWGLGVAGVLP